jgi:hypothetical protein
LVLADRLHEAARGGDLVDVAVALRMVLAFDGGRRVPAKITPRRFPPPWSIEEGTEPIIGLRVI